MLLARVASSGLWDLAAALVDYLEAEVYRDYRLFNRVLGKFLSERNSAELQGKETC